MPADPELYLAGDVGGTNTRLRLVGDDPRDVRVEEVYSNCPVDDALRRFLNEQAAGKAIAGAGLGVAGRVVDGDVQMTNRPGETITNETVAAALNLPPNKVRVVNDMVAHLAGVDACETTDLRPGTPHGEVECIVMPGTGLGTGLRVRHGDSWVPIPSEGGHLDFGPPTASLDFLRDAVHDLMGTGFEGRVSWEHLCSGPGLPRIYAAVLNPDSPREEDLHKPEDITGSATDDSCPDCDQSAAREAVRIFLTLVGARAGNLCLDAVATRQVTFGGSILNDLYARAPQLVTETVVDGFTACGPDALRPMMEAAPLRLLRSGDSGLVGAAVLARDSA